MTDRPQSPNAQFLALLSRFPAEIVALVKRSMPKLRRALPGCNEIVYDYANSVVVSFSMSERGYEAIVAVAIFPQWVRLYFDKSLPDPKRLLEGAGSKVRSVTLKSAAELDHGDIHDLVNAAIKHSGVTLPRTGSNRMIFKSESKKAKPKTKAKLKPKTKAKTTPRKKPTKTGRGAPKARRR